MKRFLALLMLSCITLIVSADPIGPTQALKIASAYLKGDAAVAQVKPLRRAATRAVAESDTLAPLYIIDRGGDAGFVIVSGDNCLPEIIGYTESGSYVAEDMPPAFNAMMEEYAQIIEAAQAAGAPARTPARAAADRVAIQPLIEAHWNQKAPYNNLAPIITGTTKRAVTGCACTAAVMVLHYFRRDLTDVLLATTPTYEKGDAPVTVSYPKGTPIEWDLMLNTYKNVSYPSEMTNAVAVLNAAFGAAIGLKYGSSTSGTIKNIVTGYNDYFNVSSKCQYQNDNTDQAEWEERIYNNLINGQPIIYRGTSLDGGGHAIILDGYTPSSNLYHFNMGWGGSGDGYYTLDKETGVGGYPKSQGMVYDITPNKPNLKGKIYVAKQTAKRVETPVRVEVTNNGTLDYSGFNLYWSTSERNPSSSSTAGDSNTELKLATGESGQFTATFKPTSDKTHYIYLTDKRCNVLDMAKVEVTATNTDITLEAFGLSTSGDTEEFQGEVFHLLHNTTATATATLSNAAQGTPAQPGLRMILYKYEGENGSLEKVRNISFDTAPLQPGETKTVEASVSRINKDDYYALVINTKLNSMDDDNKLKLATADTIIRFKVCPATLESTYAEDGLMKLQGGWDSERFSELASDITYTRYDLTQVTGINSQPLAANPNALFYTATPVEGYNIVCQGHISELRLQQGYSFNPETAHTVATAIFDPQWTTSLWNTLALPFTATVPEGYICRRPTQFTSTSLREAVLTDTLLAGKPYLLMASCEHPAPITATDITLCMEPDTTGGDIFEAILADTVADARTLVLDLDATADIQYFQRADSGAALATFTGIIRDDAKRIRATVNSTSEQAYKILAEAISTALFTYDEFHTVIEPAWNTLLLDSIATIQAAFTAMTLTTQSKVKAAAADLLAYTELYKLQRIDKSDIIDYSAYLVNPSFEKGKKEGWTTPTVSSVRTNSTLATLASGIDGSYFLYCESSSATTLKQTIENLPRGYYRLTALVGTGNEVTLFAGDITTTVTPHEWGRFHLTENTVDSVWVEDGTLTIGLESPAGWYKVDNFRLYHLGNNGETTIRLPQAEAAPIIRQGIYDLYGRRIADRSAMIPGHIYIVDGRKVVGK